MTVAELITKLQALDQTMLAMVNGYEGGLDDIESITQERVYLNYHKSISVFGEHEYCDGLEREGEYEIANAYIIHRKS